MIKFRKKPVVIDAVQWLGDNDSLVAVGNFLNEGPGMFEHSNGTDLIISTLEGQMRASLGDWIIKGVKGEFYPCKPDIFEATYEAVEDDTP